MHGGQIFDGHRVHSDLILFSLSKKQLNRHFEKVGEA